MKRIILTAAVALSMMAVNAQGDGVNGRHSVKEEDGHGARGGYTLLAEVGSAGAGNRYFDDGGSGSRGGLLLAQGNGGHGKSKGGNSSGGKREGGGSSTGGKRLADDHGSERGHGRLLADGGCGTHGKLSEGGCGSGGRGFTV